MSGRAWCHPSTPGWTAAILLVLGLLLPPAAAGQVAGGADEEDEPAGAQWRTTMEVSYLLNGGNAASSTLGLRSAVRRTEPGGQLRLDLVARRTDATRINRTAVGPSEADFEVVEERDRERTAERYSAEARYDRNLGEHFFAFVGAGWERNEFAGFNHRTVGVTGAGNQWSREEIWEVKVGYGLTYTIRRDVVPDPTRDDTFAGLRITLDYVHALTDATELEAKWVADANAEEFSELRGDFTQSVTASLTDRLALKTSLQLLWDNDPPSEALSLVAPDGSPTDQTVLVPLRHLDHSISLALVVTL